MTAHDLADVFCAWVKQDEARDIDSPELRNELARLFECVAAASRAAVLADEERRVWMERYANCHELWGYEAARVAADRFLDRWREARAAWEARDGRK